MWGWLPGRLLSGPLMGLGRLGVLPLRKGWAADCRALVCGVVGCLVLGVGNTPAVVGCWGCCGRGGLLVVGAPACLGACGGGMLSGFWGSAPWLPDPSGLLICCWGLWVGVGGLVVNCIVDASILL